MADPFRIWRDAEGKAVMKTVRTIWPDLAKALDAGAGMGERSEVRRAKRPDCQVRGNHCKGKADGRMALGGKLCCVPCWGGRGKFARNPDWDLRAAPPAEDPGKTFREMGGNWG